MKPSARKVSAVLAVYNSEKTLRACLDSLLNQTFPLEIVAVDDGSDDSTMKILSAYKEITLLTQQHAGPALARNLGASRAKGEILIFVDADMTFDPHYVEALIAPIVAGKCIGSYTANEKVANWQNVWARCWNWQEGWAPELRFPAGAPIEGTDFRAILKSEFDRVGGFDNIGYTDTWSLFRKLGVRPQRTMAVCYHKNPDNLESVLRQAKWSAKRPYKLGLVGAVYAVFRTSLPFSLLKGAWVAITRREPAFFIFKIVYDWGRFLGIIQMLTTGKLAK